MMWSVTCINMEPGTDIGLTTHLHGDDVKFH
jgi:hypothetical protein